MRNLYDILGLGSSATDLQVEQAYLVRKHALKNQERLLSDAESLELRAVEEAYALLSSPARRERYDQKLKAASQPIRYEAAPPRSIPWLRIALVTLLVLGSVGIYQHQQNKLRIEQLRIEEARAKAEAEQAEQLALAEQQRLEREKLNRDRAEEERVRREFERARYEGQRIHAQVQSVEASRQREIEREERLAQQTRAREEYAAKAAVRQQQAAMERALNRPIEGSSRRSSVAVIQNDPPRPANPYQR